MLVREPVVAGRFYPSRSDECRRDLASCLPSAEAASQPTGRIVGGIVPHAGWMCSGAVAAQVIDAIARHSRPTTVVIFGAVHVMGVRRASVFASGAWQTPLGEVRVDERLAERIASASSLIEADPYAHEREHSIEVQLPFLQHVLPGVRIVPIMVPPDAQAHVVGGIVARTCRDSRVDVVYLGSTDLTHYGPGYDFTPHGIGPAALTWAKEKNDRRMLDLILAMQADAVVGEARTHQNACGSGAIAATIAACAAAGATTATLLQHTTSFEVLSSRFREAPTDAVGYAGIVFEASAEPL